MSLVSVLIHPSKIVIGCLTLALMPVAVSAEVSIRKVYATNDRIPEHSSRLGSFGAPALNDFNEVAVITSLSGRNTTGFRSLGVLFGTHASAAEIVVGVGNIDHLTSAFDSSFNSTEPRPRITDLNDFTILTNTRLIGFSGKLAGDVQDFSSKPVSQINGDFLD